MTRTVGALALVVALGAMVAAGTGAFFSDSETSSNNVLTAGAIDVKVDHAYASYNGEECGVECEEVGGNLVVNGGFETPQLNNGQWQVFPDGTQTSWEVSDGPGLEIQNNAAGAPYEGNQLAELDSHGASDARSEIYQDIDTLAGDRYRFSFRYSPRPNNGPSGDNEIAFTIKVISNGDVVKTGTVMASAVGGGSTNWQQYSYDFVAKGIDTKIIFSDAGSQTDTLGGYIDDVRVVELACTGADYTYGGTCELWNAKDLDGEKFWNFWDIKPGDYGENQLSLHVSSNDAYSCLIAHDVESRDETCVDPEQEAEGGACVDPTGEGELDDGLEVAVYDDVDEDGHHDSGEVVLYEGLLSELVVSSDIATDGVTFLGLAWCAGAIEMNTGDEGYTCDATGFTPGNAAQTDSLELSMTVWGEQQRNNDLDCDEVADLLRNGDDQQPQVEVDNDPS